MGKTRCAVEAARQASTPCRGFVDLSALSTGAGLALHLAGTFGVPDRDDPVSAVAAQLAGPRTTVVLDNVEQIADAARGHRRARPAVSVGRLAGDLPDRARAGRGARRPPAAARCRRASLDGDSRSQCEPRPCWPRRRSAAGSGWIGEESAGGDRHPHRWHPAGPGARRLPAAVPRAGRAAAVAARPDRGPGRPATRHRSAPFDAGLLRARRSSAEPRRQGSVRDPLPTPRRCTVRRSAGVLGSEPPRSRGRRRAGRGRFRQHVHRTAPARPA